LSARDGTTQTNGSDDRRRDGPGADVEQCLGQPTLLARDGSDVVGLLSFRRGDATPDLGEFVPSAYVSTVAVAPDCRRQGIAKRLYDAILDPRSVPLEDPYVSYPRLTSWASALLLCDDTDVEYERGPPTAADATGFERIEPVTDHRDDGVDSVYHGLTVGNRDGTVD
jgi:hypothetical protein